MIWYKINRRWWIDMTQVRSFGKPKDLADTITIQWKDGKEDHFGVENADKEFAALEKFVQQMFEPIKVLDHTNDGELPFGLN